MTQTDTANTRLTSQGISATKASTVKGVVAWMGAVQAQNYPMAKWGVGIRVPGSADQVVEAAIDRAEIVRTHLLRPTWHLVSADDIYWLLAPMTPYIIASLRAREREIGLSEALFARSDSTIEQALGGREYVSREELIAALEKAKIPTDQYRGFHLLVRAELDGIVCGGPARGGKPTYALLEARVPRAKPLTKEEALATLARRCFSSRSPATLQDFVWWSGLPVGEATRAIEMIRSAFISETIDSRVYWLTQPGSTPDTGREPVYLLPSFDEFIISYRDRSAALPFEDQVKAVSSNGVFRPMIVVNGQVTGIWERTIKKDRVLVETELFRRPGHQTQTLIEAAAADYGRFLRKQAEISHKL